MEKYINAERLKDSMLAYYDCLSESANGRPYKGDTLMDYEVVDMIEDCIENAPAADVVEVVRCEKCKYYIGEYCTRDIKGRTNMFYMQPTDFCSYGQRK